MEFNRTTCGVVERDILAALKTVEEKHGITIRREGGGRYAPDGSDFTFKLKCQVVGASGENVAEKAAFERAASLFGFKPEHYNKEFTSNGERYRITGFNFRAKRMPIQAVRVRDGAAFKFADSTGGIKRQLDAA
jgi:hypothetical protein